MGRFRVTLILLLTVLVVQFVAGMIVNLYVAFPGSLPAGSAWAWSFAHTGIVPLHVALGTVILVLSLAAIEFALWAEHRAGALSVGVGFVCVAVAYLGGMWFLTYGQSDLSSLVMALGFIAACVSYTIGLLVTRPDSR